MPAQISADDLARRLEHVAARLPGLRVVACTNMAGENFVIDPAGPTIYFDGSAPIFQQRRHLVAALSMVTAEAVDRERYRAVLAEVVG